MSTTTQGYTTPATARRVTPIPQAVLNAIALRAAEKKAQMQEQAMREHLRRPQNNRYGQ